MDRDKRCILLRRVGDVFFAQDRDKRYFLLRREIRDVFLLRRVEERVGKAGDSDQGQPLHVEMEQMTNVVC